MASIWWIRRDARLADNPAALEAQAGGPASAVFPWSDAIDAWAPRRRAYLARSLAHLSEATGGAIGVRRGSPADVLSALATQTGARTVFAQQEFSPSAVRETAAVRRCLAEQGVELVLIGSPYAIAPGRVAKADGSEYRVFTPFYKAWLAHGWRSSAASADPAGFARVRGDANLDDLATSAEVADPLAYPVPTSEQAWLERLNDFADGPLRDYEQGRDYPAHDVTSHLSIPLAFGQIHPRTMLGRVAEAATSDPSLRSAAAKFTSEVAWREFHADVLHHHPHALHESLTPMQDESSWARGADADRFFEAWRSGTTGYPLVDAGMRQVAATGMMHNRVRMVVASFLVKDLHVPWQRGASYFRERLLDYDHAQNQLNWQWVAGTGRDAAPYYRIFNPHTQAANFDKDGRYIKRWIPDYGTDAYPPPIVDHAVEREVTLAAYRNR